MLKHGKPLVLVRGEAGILFPRTWLPFLKAPLTSSSRKDRSMPKLTMSVVPAPSVSLEPKPAPKLVTSPKLGVKCKEYQTAAAKQSMWEKKRKAAAADLKKWHAKHGKYLETDDYLITETAGVSGDAISAQLLLAQGVTPAQIAAATVKGTEYTYPRVTRKKELE